MIELPGYYILGKQIDEESWALYKAYDMKKEQIVGLKVNYHRDHSLRYAEAIHDYHMTQQLSSYQVLQPIRLERHGKEAYMITQQYTGMTMKKWLEQGPLKIDDFLSISIKIINILADIHQERIIHKSIQPQHLLIDPWTNELSISGFKYATTLSEEIQQPYVPADHVETELLYWSPEQTGHMNHPLDYRSDLYALGVLFYEILTGVVPFSGDNGLDIIHAHLAKMPIPPDKIAEKIPSQISKIIMKLLAKTPRMRYQSIYGLKVDLEKCMQQFYNLGEIDVFALGKHDQTSIFKKSHPLFGREAELKQLDHWYTQFKKGEKNLYLISGPSGIGKTVLANELQHRVVRENGYFIAGKFSHMEENIPYAPFIQAFKHLFQMILSEGSDVIEKWKEILKIELGGYGQVIAAFIPEIELLIGKQSKPIHLPPKELRNRFLRAFGIFVRIFAQEKHPLLLFVDDLQWADQATIELLDYLMHDDDITYLCIIGAYRDDELLEKHPFGKLIEKLSVEARLAEMKIKPLKYMDVQLWTDDVFPISTKSSKVIYDFVYHVSQGNPLYIGQLLQLLYDEKVVCFQNNIGEWSVNTDVIHDLKVSGSISSYISKRLDKLHEETMKIVQFAACIGNTFDLKQLAHVVHKDYIAVSRQLWPALEMGIILPLDQNYKWVYPEEDMMLVDQNPPQYRFLHDHIFQTVYLTLSLEERERNHLHIGNMFTDLYYSNIEEHIFEIVNHLNLSRNLLTGEQKLLLAEKNQIAGKRARGNMALEASLSFYITARELLPEACWADSYYKTTIQIMMGLGEVQYLTKDFRKAEQTFDEIIAHAQSFEDTIGVIDLKVSLYTLTFELEKAVDTGLEGIRLFKWPVHKHPKKSEVVIELLRTKWLLFINRGKDLLNLPAAKEGNPRLALRTLINTISSAYFVDQNLATVLMLRALRLTLKYGDMDITAIIYNSYALTLSAGFDDFEGSYYFGKLAIAHTEKYDDLHLKSTVFFIFGSYINHWKHHMCQNTDYLERAQQLGEKSGNLHIVGASAAFIGMTLLVKGDHIGNVSARVKEQLHYAKDSEFTLSDNYLREILKWIKLLINPPEQLDWKLPAGIEDHSSLFVHQTLRLQMTYLFQNETEAVKIMDHVESTIDDPLTMFITPEYYFYYCLWTIKHIKEQKISLKEGKKRIRKKMKRLKKWAESSPDNYQHQYLLLQAELKGISYMDNTVASLYQTAILLATKNGFQQDAAIANECAANYYLADNLPLAAKGYMTDAYVWFQKWGAEAKAIQLMAKYPALIFVEKQEQPIVHKRNESLDLYTAFQVATVISSEINFKQLVQKIMEVLLAHGGGERASLMLLKQNKIRVVANYHLNGNTQFFQEWKDVDDTKLPKKVIDYVVASQKEVVLHHACKSERFTKDRYISLSKVRSVLCLPILNQAKLTGILYLENNQISSAFSERHIQLLTLLASQVAISIENTYLYDHLETEVRERTRLLNEVNQSLMHTNHLLAQSKEEKRDFFANISHDLRSPIATVNGYIDAILEGIVEEPEQQKHYLQVVKNRLHALNRLIGDLFELAQLELGNIKFSKELFPLDEVFTYLCRQYELEVTQSNLDFKWELPVIENKQFPFIEIDKGRIEQVFMNLVLNAIRYARRKIHISLIVEQEGRAIISIADDGQGIPASDVEKVFQRLYTKTDDPKQQGYGLGLAICREIISCHQGEIYVQSEVGEGTTFLISLPVFTVQ